MQSTVYTVYLIYWDKPFYWQERIPWFTLFTVVADLAKWVPLKEKERFGGGYCFSMKSLDIHADSSFFCNQYSDWITICLNLSIHSQMNCHFLPGRDWHSPQVLNTSWVCMFRTYWPTKETSESTWEATGALTIWSNRKQSPFLYHTGPGGKLELLEHSIRWIGQDLKLSELTPLVRFSTSLHELDVDSSVTVQVGWSDAWPTDALLPPWNLIVTEDASI